MGILKSWLLSWPLSLPLGAAVCLSWALVACGGTSDVPIGEGGVPEGATDQASPDGPLTDHTMPSEGGGPDGGPDQISPTDGGTEVGPFDAPFDVTPVDAPFDIGPFDSPFDTADSPMDAPDDEDAPFDAGPCTTTCVPPVPGGGWTGPEELYDNSSTPPSCGPSFNFFADYDGYAMLEALPADCSTCTCGGPTGVTCSPVTTGFFTDAACTMACSTTGTALTDGTCTDVTGAILACGVTTSGDYLEISRPTVTGGSCAASTETYTVPPVTWGIQSQACSPASGAATGNCSGGDTCVPATDPDYLPTYCIFQSGSVPCPSTGYTTQYVFYGGHDDDRMCTDCSCGMVSAAACAGGEVDAYSDACVTETGEFTPLPQTCTAVPTGTTHLEYTAATSTGSGSCKAGGGEPVGGATPTEPTTFCCTP
jgi:hypothetical protein